MILSTIRMNLSGGGKKTITRTTKKQTSLKEWPDGRWEERTYEYFLCEKKLIKYEDSDKSLSEFKFEIWGKRVMQTYSSNKKGWWKKKFEWHNNLPKCIKYECENHSWKRTYIVLLDKVYQTSYEKFDIDGNVIDHSESEYKIVKDEVIMVYNNNSEEQWRKDYTETEDGRIVEIINN